MTDIAGHDFQETSTGRRCVKPMLVIQVCGMSWMHVRSATESDLGRHGFAHQGGLNAAELRQIAEERQKEVTDVWEAVVDAASAGSR